MAIPLRDESRPLSRFPIALTLIVTANVIMFLIELALGDSFVLRYSLKPAEIVRGEHLETIFTSMFMHANFLHIAGNMIYLWVFGDELEANYLGPLRFTIFYFVCGLAATALQIAVDPTSTTPNLGASGAIAGVLGGFQIVFPNDRILLAIFAGFWVWNARVASWILIAVWIALQVYGGLSGSSAQGGVAYFAHIGGFAAGLLLIRLFGAGNPLGGSGEQY
jgi:membrane associated rhomboid family serine protease